MRRGFVAGILVLPLLIVVAFLVAIRYRSASLSPTDLSAKPVTPPKGWADECSRRLRAVRAAQKRSLQDAGSLSADEVAIYRLLLQQWNSNSPSRTLNVADRTSPLDITSHGGEIAACQCLEGFEAQALVDASHSFHRLTQDSLPAIKIRLVNARDQLAIVRQNDPDHWNGKEKSAHQVLEDAFASGLFSMSEIVFDPPHRKALVSTSFVCGGLCGSGGTWLLEKVDGVWKKTDRQCGGWIR